MMNIPGVWESFAEGVKYTTEEGWVDPDDIQDLALQNSYRYVVDAYKAYTERARDFDKLLNAKAEEAGILD